MAKKILTPEGEVPANVEENSAPVVKKAKENSIYVDMVKDGIIIHGVHPDAVPAHEAIGYKLVPVEKSIEPADHTANNG